MNQVHDRLDEVDQQRLPMTVCHSGNHSFRMADLFERGYVVENLQGRIQQRANRGPPVPAPGDAGRGRAA